MADARRRHLAPGAAVTPARARPLAAAVSLIDLAGGDVTMSEEAVPYVHAVWAVAGYPFDVRLYRGGADPAMLMSAPGTFEDLDFTQEPGSRGGDLRLRITSEGRIDGLLAWIELQAGPDGPFADSLAGDTGWLPVYFPFAQEPLQVTVGDVLALSVTSRQAGDGIHPEFLVRGRLDQAGSAVEVTAESRYSGGPFRGTPVHRMLFPWSKRT